MTDHPGDNRRIGPGRVERRSHHISSIAHLFFAADGQPAAGALRLAVAGLGGGRASAFACAGLVAASRAVARPDGRDVLLEEDGGLTWSAASYLAPERAVVPEQGYPRSASPAERAPLADGGAIRWDHLGDLGRTDLSRLERWCGALASHPAGWDLPGGAPGRDGLVVCATAPFATSWQGAFLLGRLLGVLAPRRLEMVLFPASWSPAVVADSAASGADGLRRIRRLAESVQPGLAVEVTVGLPEAGRPGSGAARTLLEAVAQRLLSDFEVDPGS